MSAGLLDSTTTVKITRRSPVVKLASGLCCCVFAPYFQKLKGGNPFDIRQPTEPPRPHPCLSAIVLARPFGDHRVRERVRSRLLLHEPTTGPVGA
jgi:hypothetical protein